MTNEEAIIALKRIRKDWQFTYSYDCEAVEMAIRALKNEQTECDNKHDCEHCDWTECPLEVEKETDGDSVSLQALAEKFKLPSAEKTAEEPIKHFGAIECPNCGRLLMLEEQTYSWCKGCKEYDTEKHCCHRYSSFIRESLQENINAVLEDIKADIAEEICLTDNPYTEQTEYTISHEKVLEIIDKHISGKE